MIGFTLRFHFFIGILAVITNANPQPQNQQQQTNSPQAQYVHEKDNNQKMETSNEDASSRDQQFHLTNDFKQEQLPGTFLPWNPYRQEDLMASNRFYNIFGYSNSILVPYPVIVSPEYLYQYNGGTTEYDDSQSRSNVRRQSSPYRNSPIYYVRLPPTPYMFVPGLGYTSQPPTFNPNFGSVLQYNPISTLPIQPPPQPTPINPFINLPLNFLANGKPTNIYQLDPNGIPAQFPSFYPTKPYRPQYLPQPPQPQQQQYMQDSKITHLKRPFMFNGRPEDIYLLQNNYNPLQNNYNPLQNNYNPLQNAFNPLQNAFNPIQNPFNSIYQNPMQGYY